MMIFLGVMKARIKKQLRAYAQYLTVVSAFFMWCHAYWMNGFCAWWTRMYFRPETTSSADSCNG
jgi:hypothetical protein